MKLLLKEAKLSKGKIFISGIFSVSASMDEEETTHPVASIAEKESDFLEKAGTSSSGWQDSRIPLYGTEGRPDNC